MKQFLMAIVLVLALSATASAQAVVNLAWDPMPAGQSWQAVRIYELSGTTYTKVAEVAGTATTATLQNVVPGKHTYVARAFDGTWESPDSNQVSTPPIPAVPTNLKFTVTITITQ